MTTVLCFGDSNTHGTVAIADPARRERLAFAERWPSIAEAALGGDWHLIAEGHPGRTTVHPDPVEGGHKSGLAALLPLLESHRPIDMVVLMLGTNDLKHRFALTPDDIALGVERLAGVIAGSGCGPGQGAPRLLIVAPAPVAPAGVLSGMFTGAAAPSRALAPRLAEVAVRQGAAFLDAGAVEGVAVDPVDGIHLTAAAHRALGHAAAAALREMT